MRTIKYSILVVCVLATSLFFKGCADLEVDNLNNPTREAVLSDVNNTLKLLRGGFQTATQSMASEWGVHMHMLTDQTTSTNAFRVFWDFSEEPRLRVNNNSTYSGEQAISTFWGDFNSSIAVANQFINLIENEDQTFVQNGVDRTNEILSQAYFLRGLSRGYLGLIYDQAYLLPADFDPTTGENPEFADYGTVIDNAVSDLDQAISLSQDASDFTFASMPNNEDSWTQAEYEDILNSLAARFLAGKARTPAERDQIDWTAVEQYANAGLGGPNASSTLMDWTASNVGSSGEYANDLADWLNFVVACEDADDLTTCAGYNPTDVKQIHLLDPSYPTEYPASEATASEASLEPAESNDPRLEGYFVYTTNPGFLNPSRNANLFTNYFSLRYYADSDWWPSTYGITLITSVETDMLRAEAQVMQQQTGEAATTLNNSTAGSGTISLSTDLPAKQLGEIDFNGLSGGYSYDGSESLAEFQWALLREYSVELSLMGGIGLQWWIMRRHDMLQEGTATMFPVPGQELEITGREGYTFGGPQFAGETGTALGGNSWKDLADKAFGKDLPKAKAGSSVSIDKDNIPAPTKGAKGGHN